MSKRSGSGNCSSSRLTEAIQIMTAWCLAMCCPPRTVSSFAMRNTPERGEIAQDLLYRAWNERRLVAQFFRHMRILIKADECIAKQVGRCLVARDQQQATKL